MAMKITLLEINDFKRVSSAVIEPGERNLILLGGNNMQGKSSVMGAMRVAMGGTREAPEDPIRHGAKQASIRVVFDDGVLTVRRKFTQKGTTLEVTNADGKVAAPQKMLDHLIGARFLDPMKFSRLSAIEQRKVLLGCVDLGIDLDANQAEEKKAYEARRDINRDIKQLEARIDFPGPGEPGCEIDPSDVMTELERLGDDARAAANAVARIAEVEAQIEASSVAVGRSQAAFIAARDAVKASKEAHTKVLAEGEAQIESLRCVSADGIAEQIAEAKETLAGCSAHNAEVLRARAALADYNKVRGELDVVVKVSGALTEQIESLKESRVAALSEAKMPIAGLSFDDEGLLLNGVPFDQASGAEKLRASIAIAWALKPELGDIWVEDGALLDSSSVEMVEEFARENGLRVWLERVGEGDAEAIIMVDGEVK